MRPLIPTGQRFLTSEMPLTGALKPIDQQMQEELMRGTDLPIQLLLSQIKPKLLGKRGRLAQVVILGIATITPSMSKITASNGNADTAPSLTKGRL